VPAATAYGANYDDLRDLYGVVSGQRWTEINRLQRYVGGVVETNYHVGHGDPVFKPVSKSDQAAALHFLLQEGTHMPESFTNRWLLSKIYPDGDVTRVVSRQNALLSSLLSEGRVQRLLDNEAENGSSAYTVSQLASDVQNGVWSELDQSHPNIDVFRRSLQSNYLVMVDSRINGPGATKTDLAGIEREDLRKLAKKIDKAIVRAASNSTAVHLKEARRVINLIVDGKYPQPPPLAPAATPQFGRPGGNQGEFENCWPVSTWGEVAGQ